eukprot:14289167-Alexandrium_andersonii.AAC.1
MRAQRTASPGPSGPGPLPCLESQANRASEGGPAPRPRGREAPSLQTSREHAAAARGPTRSGGGREAPMTTTSQSVLGSNHRTPLPGRGRGRCSLRRSLVLQHPPGRVAGGQLAL